MLMMISYATPRRIVTAIARKLAQLADCNGFTIT
jgi:hypothetical protein